MSHLENTVNHNNLNLYRQTLIAIAWGLFGWTCFAFADALTKWLTQSYSVSQVLCLSSFASAVMAGAWITYKHSPRGFHSHALKWHLGRSICTCVTSFLVVSAISRIPLADFYGIVFLSPMAVAILSSLILGERIGIHRLIAIIVGFCGVLILAGPQFNHLNIGLVLAFGSVSTIALSSILVRKIGKEPVTLLYAFYPSLFTATLNAPLMLPGYTPVDPTHMIYFFILPVLVLCGSVGFALGFAKAPEAAVVAPFHYTQIIWGVIFGFVLFGDIPTPATIVGTSIIISAGLYLIWREHVNHRRRDPIEAAVEESHL